MKKEKIAGRKKIQQETAIESATGKIETLESEPPAKKPWFNRMADRSAIIVISIVIGINLIPYVQNVFSTPSLDSMAKQYLTATSIRNLSAEDTAYQIDDNKYSFSELNDLYKDLTVMQYGDKGSQRYLQNPDTLAFFIRHQFETDLLAQKAVSENILRDARLQRILAYYLKNRLAELYVYSQLRNKMTDFENPVSEGEVHQFYLRNKKEYDAKKISEKTALSAIEETLNKVRRQQSLELIGQFRQGLLDFAQKEKKVLPPGGAR